MTQGTTGNDPHERLHQVAALGCLLNAIAHDLNNQLTNLLLGADQAQYGGGRAAIDLMVQQATRITDITRAIQALGQRNMERGVERCSMAAVCADFQAWQETTGAPRPTLDRVDGADPAVEASPANLVLALALLVRALRSAEAPALSLAVEQVPRSSWSGSTETVPMAALRLRWGNPSGEPNGHLKATVDDFFGEERSPEESLLMAAWEILRKIRGRLALFGEPGSADQEAVLHLPLAGPR